jgi:hypothetical protein
MAKTCQSELRFEEDEVRDSIRMYVRDLDDQQQFLDSVERGWYELRSGPGEVGPEDDSFFESVSREIRNNGYVGLISLQHCS